MLAHDKEKPEEGPNQLGLIPGSRICGLSLQREHLDVFRSVTRNIPLLALQISPAKREEVAASFQEIIGEDIVSDIKACFTSRERGAILIEGFEFTKADEDSARIDAMVKLSIGVISVVGKVFPDTPGSFHRLIESNKQEIGDGVRIPSTQRFLGLHTDTAAQYWRFPQLDLLTIAKVSEKNIELGQSTLLHMDDFPGIETFKKARILWDGNSPAFFSNSQGECMRIGCVHKEPLSDYERSCHMSLLGAQRTIQEAHYTTRIALKEGDLLFINNSVWLHGREKLGENENLNRKVVVMSGTVGEWNRPAN